VYRVKELKNAQQMTVEHNNMIICVGENMRNNYPLHQTSSYEYDKINKNEIGEEYSTHGAMRDT
jgi:hypothetical protein